MFSGYDISGEIVPLVRYLWWDRTPGYDFSREIVPSQFGYDLPWVRFLLGTISPAIKISAPYRISLVIMNMWKLPIWFEINSHINKILRPTFSSPLVNKKFLSEGFREGCLSNRKQALLIGICSIKLN